jgi:hypothetical protein
MTGADLATAADVAALGAKLDLVLDRFAQLEARLPPILEPASATAKRIHLDVRTLTTRHPEGVVRVGRRLLFNPAVLLSKSAAEIAALAREARS